jgi:hypothetical protein
MIQVGKTYSFKTPTFYYVGEVTRVWPTHAEIKNGREVFETGSNADYYSGKIKTSEGIPDGFLVPLTGGVSIAPFERIKL